MNRLLKQWIPSVDEHLSDDRLASLFCDELPWADRWVASQHLSQCLSCRVRREDLEVRRANRVKGLYRQMIEEEKPILSTAARANFLERLDQRIQKNAASKRRPLRLPKISLPEHYPMNPALATCILCGLAAVVAFVVWLQQRTPNISSNALLVRAERWDTTRFSHSNSVVFQKVSIKTSKQTLQRAIYRDPKGSRRPRQVKLESSEEQVKARLTGAGVDWDEPLSASAYQNWHDRQHVREDRISRSGRHLLTLRTTTPEGSVAEESFTVRDTDFHPVRRTIAFRDSETVEVAELDFKILPWSAVEDNVFEPIGALNRAGLPMPSLNVIPFPRMPETLSQEQLDETELGARLVLNRLHADTGQQIEIARNPQGIEVKGVVQTEERKHELQARLEMLPHVKASIASEADLKNSPGNLEGSPASIGMVSMPDQISPLETYLHTRGRSTGAINSLAQRLFNNALLISQESKAINDLDTRFVFGEQRTVIAAATLADLFYSHRERLESALEEERNLLSEIRGTIGDGSVNSSLPAQSLMDAAERHLALCKELTATNSPAARQAETILLELSNSLDELIVDEHKIHAHFQSGIAQDGKN